MQKIIFIDIDGPIINTPIYSVDPRCSMERSTMNTQAIGYICELVKLSDAKIVTNSTHNTHDVEDLLTGEKRTLKQDLIKWGLKEEWFHENWHTSYPFPNGSRFSEHTSHRRMKAIDEWQEVNGEVDWVCFDDEPFTEDPRLVVIDFERGIDFDAFSVALKQWNLKRKMFIL